MKCFIYHIATKKNNNKIRKNYKFVVIIAFFLERERNN